MRGRRVSPAVAVVSVDRPRTLRYRKAAVEEPSGPGARHVLGTFVLALLLAGGLAGLGWAFQSDTFRVRQVTISGASPAVQQAIEDLVAPGCAESLAGPIECPAGNLGPNELTLNAGGIARQVEQLPLVKSVQVKAVLPKRLEIRATTSTSRSSRRPSCCRSGCRPILASHPSASSTRQWTAWP